MRSRAVRRRTTACRAVWAKREFDTGNVNLPHALRWIKVLPFNPNSTEQIKAYIRFRGQPLSPRPLTREDARQIRENLTGFFRQLAAWDAEMPSGEEPVEPEKQAA